MFVCLFATVSASQDDLLGRWQKTQPKSTADWAGSPQAYRYIEFLPDFIAITKCGDYGNAVSIRYGRLGEGRISMFAYVFRYTTTRTTLILTDDEGKYPATFKKLGDAPDTSDAEQHPIGPLDDIPIFQHPAGEKAQEIPNPQHAAGENAHEGLRDTDNPKSILVPRPPPPQIPEQMPTRPNPKMVWIPGYWDYRNNQYNWIGGAWVVPPQRSHWVAPQWIRQVGQIIFVFGHWQQR